jgi:hypothetical protein
MPIGGEGIESFSFSYSFSFVRGLLDGRTGTRAPHSAFRVHIPNVAESRSDFG